MKYLVLLIAGFSFIFIGCSKTRKSSEITLSQQQLLSYVPSDAQFVMYMNIMDLKSSAYWDDYLSLTLNDYKENFWIAEFQQRIGKPVEKYISDFLLASMDTERSIKIYKFASGEDKLKLYLSDKKYFSKKVDGAFTFYESLKNPGSYFMIEDPSVLITLNWRTGLANLLIKNYRPLKENRNFVEIIEQIGNKRMYWMATDRGSFASAMMRKISSSKGYSQVVKVLSSVNSITFQADFSQNMEIESVWGCNDPASSGLIAAAARSAIAMDLFSDKEYALGKIMDKVSVETDASDVVFKISLNKDDIRELKNIAEKRNLDKKL